MHRELKQVFIPLTTWRFKYQEIIFKKIEENKIDFIKNNNNKIN